MYLTSPRHRTVLCRGVFNVNDYTYLQVSLLPKITELEEKLRVSRA